MQCPRQIAEPFVRTGDFEGRFAEKVLVWHKRADVGYESNVLGDGRGGIDDKNRYFRLGIDFLVLFRESIRLLEVEFRERKG